MMQNLDRTVQVIEGLEGLEKVIKGTEDKSALEVIGDILKCADGIIGIAKWWEDLDEDLRTEAVTIAKELWDSPESVSQERADKLFEIIMGEDYSTDNEDHIKQFNARKLHLIQGLKDINKEE